MDLAKQRILLTGGGGFLGSFVLEELLRRGVPKKNIFIPRAEDMDLREMSNCRKAAEGKTLVIHLAAKVGGIGLNKEKPGELFYDTLTMGVQLA